MKRYKFTFPGKISFGIYGSINITYCFTGTIFQFIKQYGFITFLRYFQFKEYKPRILKCNYSIEAYQDLQRLCNSDVMLKALQNEMNLRNKGK